MSSNALTALRREIAIDQSVADVLTEAEVIDLSTLLQEAKAHKAKQLDGAITEALEHFPRLIRIAARKILFR